MARMGGSGHMPNTRCGGMSSPGEPDQEVQDLCNKLKHKALELTNATFTEFTAVKVASQSVAGTNYFVKVHIGNDVYAHLRIFVPLPCNGTEPELSNILYPKTKDCALEYF